jgi:hypothetical protein
MLVAITMVLQSLSSATIIVSTASALRLLRRLVYNFVLDLGLGAAQINAAAIHISLLDILNQMLGNAFVLKSNKAKPTTGVSVWILHNLNILDLSKLTKESTKLLLAQVIV